MLGSVQAGALLWTLLERVQVQASGPARRQAVVPAAPSRLPPPAPARP